MKSKSSAHKTFVSLIFLFVIFFSASLNAQEENDFDYLEINFVDQIPRPKTKTEAQRLIDDVILQSHEIIEGEEHENLLSNWKENFNFPKKALDIYRWINFNQSTIVRNFVFDAVSVFAISHSIEMSSGPTMLVLGISNQWPEWLTTILTTAGATVSIPGLDPLCMIVFATYFGSSHVRDFIGAVRMGVIKGVDTTAEFTGAKRFLQERFSKEEIALRFQRHPFLEDMIVTDDKIILKYKVDWGGKNLAELQLAVKNNRLMLEEAQIDLSEANAEDIKYLRRYFSSFGWSIGSALKDIVVALQGSKPVSKRFYIDLVDQIHAQKVRVTYFENAVSGGPKLTRRTAQMQDCVDKVP